ncbi:MAG: DinB family protein [Chloroflexota bacterium]
MRRSNLIKLFEYNYWARDQILDAAQKLSTESLSAENTISYGSIMGLLTHTLNAEAMWLERCRDGVSPESVRFKEPIANLQELARLWQVEEEQMLAYIKSLDEAALDQAIPYQGFSGRSFENTLWHILMQLIYHGISHRAEIAGQLTELGHSPGNLDFIIYLRE